MTWQGLCLIHKRNTRNNIDLLVHSFVFFFSLIHSFISLSCTFNVNANTYIFTLPTERIFLHFHRSIVSCRRNILMIIFVASTHSSSSSSLHFTLPLLPYSMWIIYSPVHYCIRTAEMFLFHHSSFFLFLSPFFNQ